MQHLTSKQEVIAFFGTAVDLLARRADHFHFEIVELESIVHIAVLAWYTLLSNWRIKTNDQLASYQNSFVFDLGRVGYSSPPAANSPVDLERRPAF
jgi:hypothetical protein